MPKYDILTQDIVVMYTEKQLTLEEISKLTGGLTRQGIWKRLKVAGIDTKHRKQVETECFICNKAFTLTKKRHEQAQRHYCSQDCYLLSRSNPDYIPWRQGGRLARIIVREYYSLIDTDIVHHIDSNQRNNKVSNLIVFASQSDHLKWHHKINKVEPLWDGRLI